MKGNNDKVKILFDEQLTMFNGTPKSVLKKLEIEKSDEDMAKHLADFGIRCVPEAFRRNKKMPEAYQRDSTNEFDVDGGFLILKTPNLIEYNNIITDYILLADMADMNTARRAYDNMIKASGVSGMAHPMPVGVVHPTKGSKYYLAQIGTPIINFSDMECLTGKIKLNDKIELLDKSANQLMAGWSALAKKDIYMTEFAPLWHVHTNSSWVYNLSSYGGGVVGPAMHANAGLLKSQYGIECVLTGFDEMADKKSVSRPVNNLYKGTGKESRIGRVLTSMAMATCYQGMSMDIPFDKVVPIVEKSFSEGLKVLTGKGKSMSLNSSAEDEISDYTGGHMIDAPPFVEFVDQFLKRI